MMAVVAGVPEEVTAAISEDPATVQAQIDEGARSTSNRSGSSFT